MVQYIVFEGQQDGATNFGIAAISDGIQIDRIKDVATDQAKALGLAGMLQQNCVAGDQFRFIVEDFIVE